MQIFKAIGIALLAALVWEILRKTGMLVHALIRKRNALSTLLDFDHHVVLAATPPAGDEANDPRGAYDPGEAQAEVAAALARRIRGRFETDAKENSLKYSTSHQIVIGSPRHNGVADDLQRAFDLPFQYVVTTAAGGGRDRVFSIVTSQGDELTPSRDDGGEQDGERIDYGILFLGKLASGKKVLWISGIHDAGTRGVHDYLVRNAAPIHDALADPERDGDGLAWLFRVRYTTGTDDYATGTDDCTTGTDDATEARDTGDCAKIAIRSTELLGGPLAATRKTGAKPRALICDLGRVIVDFDRNRTYRAFAKRLGKPAEELRAQVDRTDLAKRYESGAIDDDTFCDELAAVLGGDSHTLPRDFIEKFYGDIFSPIPEVVAALEYLRRQEEVPLVLLSNTCPLHFSWISDDCADAIGLFDEAVLSFDVKILKPDPEIFQIALDKALACCSNGSGNGSAKPVPATPATPADVLYIDDMEEYVETAKSLGMRGIVFRSYPRFVFWLRRAGLYVP
jgi:glucose-1-phosphatase